MGMMFLNELNGEERVAFLELAHLVAKSNGIVDEKEKKMLDTYSQEMGVDLVSTDLNQWSLEKITAFFESERTKRIVFLEAIAVAFADGVYHDEQKSLIRELKEGLSISDEEYEEFKAWIIKVTSLYSQAEEFIGA